MNEQGLVALGGLKKGDRRATVVYGVCGCGEDGRRTVVESMVVRREKKREFLELVLQAFADAKAKGKPNWRTMDLSVLKNHLLHRTNRRFQVSDFGAQAVAELVAQLPDVLAVGKGCKPTVKLLAETADSPNRRYAVWRAMVTFGGETSLPCVRAQGAK